MQPAPKKSPDRWSSCIQCRPFPCQLLRYSRWLCSFPGQLGTLLCRFQLHHSQVRELIMPSPGHPDPYFFSRSSFLSSHPTADTPNHHKPPLSKCSAQFSPRRPLSVPCGPPSPPPLVLWVRAIPVRLPRPVAKGEQRNPPPPSPPSSPYQKMFATNNDCRAATLSSAARGPKRTGLSASARRRSSLSSRRSSMSSSSTSTGCRSTCTNLARHLRIGLRNLLTVVDQQR